MGCNDHIDNLWARLIGEDMPFPIDFRQVKRLTFFCHWLYFESGFSNQLCNSIALVLRTESSFDWSFRCNTGNRKSRSHNNCMSYYLSNGFIFSVCYFNK